MTYIYSAVVQAAFPPNTDSLAIEINAPASTTVKIRRIRIMHDDGTALVTSDYYRKVKLVTETTPGTGGTIYTPTQFDANDPVSVSKVNTGPFTVGTISKTMDILSMHSTSDFLWQARDEDDKIILRPLSNPWALSFVSASSQYVACTSNAILGVGETASSEMSYSLWVRITGNPTDTVPLVQKGGSGGQAMNPYIYTDGAVYADIYFNTHAVDSAAGTPPISDSKWHHIVCSNKATGNSQIWMDGTKYVDDANNDYLSSTSGNPFRIAHDNGYLATYFSGQIDDVRVYNVQLTSAEVIALNTGVDITRGIVAHWNFDEGTGTTTTDSVNAIVGTLTNGPTWYNTTLPFNGSSFGIIVNPAN